MIVRVDALLMLAAHMIDLLIMILVAIHRNLLVVWETVHLDADYILEVIPMLLIKLKVFHVEVNAEFKQLQQHAVVVAPQLVW